MYSNVLWKSSDLDSSVVSIDGFALFLHFRQISWQSDPQISDALSTLQGEKPHKPISVLK